VTGRELLGGSEGSRRESGVEDRSLGSSVGVAG
jgi:hypothetical protein